MILAQLTDTHVTGPSNDEPLYVDNNGRLALAVKALNAEAPRPDAIIATGDLANWGRTDEYEALIDLLTPLRIPILPLGGNHDERSRFRAAFDGFAGLHPTLRWADSDHVSWTAEIGDVTVIGLDSNIPDEAGARFDADRRAWLEAALASTDGPTVLALHHPPFTTGIGWMDRSGFDGLADLVAVLDRHRARTGRGVERILCGHLHRPITTQVAGATTQTGLSTIQHVNLSLDPDAPIELINDPAGYLLHWYENGTWVCHTRYIDTGADPYVPHWA